MKSVFLKILMLSLLISIIGILSIYSGTYQKDIADWQAVSKRQVIWLGICLIFFLAFSSLNYRRL
ncbi:MAG: hypothetical protein KJ793_06250, partial [Candidatus Omnitrophica bacterium]|nr:hypothetical protein [Candidatus Omnitrophota bacterium]